MKKYLLLLSLTLLSCWSNPYAPFNFIECDDGNINGKNEKVCKLKKKTTLFTNGLYLLLSTKTNDAGVTSTLSYTPNTSFVFGVGLAIDYTISPTVTGTVTSYSISPSIPSGLNFNTSTGVISGTPTTIQGNTSYTITASNDAGSTTTSISISIGNFGICYMWGCFKDNMNGTVSFTGASGTFGGNTYTAQNLTWMKCSQGQTYNSGTNNCDGTAGWYQYCSANDNSCNSTSTWLLNGTGSSQAYTTCDNLVFGGYSDWRVPQKNELKTLIHCTNKAMPGDGDWCRNGNYTTPTISTLYPNTVALYYWSSSTYVLNTNSAWFVYFYNGNVNYNDKARYPLRSLC